MTGARKPNLYHLALLGIVLLLTLSEELHLRRWLWRHYGNGSIIAAIVAGLSLYEIAQIWMPTRTFDWNDLFATILGGVVCWLLLALPAMLSRQQQAKAATLSQHPGDSQH